VPSASAGSYVKMLVCGLHRPVVVRVATATAVVERHPCTNPACAVPLRDGKGILDELIN
jgi:hypothetical protein